MSTKTPIRYAVDVLGPVTAEALTPLPQRGQTRSGYGRALPTHRMLQFGNTTRWYRVRVVCYSNAGTAYVTTKTARFLVVRDTDFTLSRG